MRGAARVLIKIHEARKMWETFLTSGNILIAEYLPATLNIKSENNFR